MAFFPDLSPYTYLRGARPGLVNVGWLARGHRFPHGPTPPEFHAALAEHCRRPAHQTWGYHECEFCRRGLRGILRHLLGWPPARGSAEIHVPGPRGKTYAAPTLIYHYVVAHRYRPPEEFVQAVLAGAEGACP